MRLTYVYEDGDDRPVAALQAPEWTEDDLDLMRGLELYEATLCPGCQQPKRLCWHQRTDEEWDGNELVCHACSAKQGHEVVYSSPTLLLSPEQIRELPPWDRETMITKPKRRAPGG